jgi:hypothetical protein
MEWRERRHANGLALFQPGVGLHAPAVDAHLTGAQQLLQMAEAEPRIVRLEPAVEAHTRLAWFHRQLFYTGHRLLILSPLRLAPHRSGGEPPR